MRGVKQKDTKPEVLVRKALHARGYRFRLHGKALPGKPDIILRKHRLVIFVHGCFWHQHDECQEGRLPDSNTEYWIPKLRRNVERDEEKAMALRAQGWRVETVWECEAKDSERLERRISEIFDPA